MKQVTIRKHCSTELCRGELIYTGHSFHNSVGGMYEHKCTTCGCKEQFKNKHFPQTYTEFDPEEREEVWE